MKLKRLIITVIALLPMVCLAKVVPLNDYRATYDIQINSMPIGTITHQLYSKNGQYLLELDAVSSLPIPVELSGNEQSEGVWQEGYPKPNHYSYHYSYEKERKNQDITFNWSALHAINQKNQRIVPIEEHTQDKISYQLALRQDLRQHKPTLSYQIADGKRLKTYDFVLKKNRETLKTPLGEIDTVIIERTAKDQVTRLWAAPQYDYLLIQIEHEQGNGMVVTAKLAALESLPPPQSGDKKVDSKTAVIPDNNRPIGQLSTIH